MNYFKVFVKILSEDKPFLFLPLVDYKGDNCNDEKKYMKDFCVDKAIERESLDKVGCTTPYGPEKDQICNHKDDGSSAIKVYASKGMTAWDESNSTKECLNPCSTFTFATKSFKKEISGKFNKFNNSIVNIFFDKKFFKVTEEYYIYTGINLIAEIGGYVGLFLGISINQVIYLMDFTASKFKLNKKDF